MPFPLSTLAELNTAGGVALGTLMVTYKALDQGPSALLNLAVVLIATAILISRLPQNP